MNVLRHDIICGTETDFTRQTVDCSPPNHDFKTYLTLFINTSVNSLLLGNAQRLGFVSPVITHPDRVCRLKQESFIIGLNVDYYTMFQDYMQRTTTLNSASVFNLDYIPNILQQPIYTVDGSIINYKILHLFIAGLTIFLASSAGWLDIKQVLEYIETGGSIYSLFLPTDTLVPPSIIQGLLRGQFRLPPSYKDIRSIQNLYMIVAYNFFTYGGASVVPTLSRNVGITRKYKANTTIVVPVPPSPFPKNQIAWDNGAIPMDAELYKTVDKKLVSKADVKTPSEVRAVIKKYQELGGKFSHGSDQSLSRNIHLSSYDEMDTDIGFLLQDGLIGGKFIICHRDNPVIVIQEWRIDNVYTDDDSVSYTVNRINFTRNVANNEVCEIVILKPGQLVPDQTDYLRRRFLESTHYIGGRKKRQNKSKRKKQKKSNKKLGFSKRRYRRRMY